MISFAPAKFYIYVNQSQVSWIQGGLSEWFSQEKKAGNASVKNTEIFTAENQEVEKDAPKRESDSRPSVS